MEKFIVSARKYRPTTFESVIGQSHITSTLQNAIKNNKLAQAFLFCGPRGIGKTTCARILAKTINCENIKENTEACNECHSCKTFNQSTSFNIHELDAASNNTVDDIRNLIEQVRYAPQSGKYKIYIIDEVHMLSSSAFNAFLKTLEEPPSYAIFILATTEKHKIIPTILSRCQIFDFKRILNQDIVNHLKEISLNEGHQAEEDALHILAEKSDGALRDALSMYDQMVNFSGGIITYPVVINNLHILDYDYYFKITDSILAEDNSSLLLVYDEIINKGFDGHNFINGLSLHFRNLLISGNEKTSKLLEVGPAVQKKYVEQAKKCSKPLLLTAMNLSNKCDIEYKSSKNQRLHVELTLLKICHINSAIELASSTTDMGIKKKILKSDSELDSTKSNIHFKPSLGTENLPTHESYELPSLKSPVINETGSNMATTETLIKKISKELTPDFNSISHSIISTETIKIGTLNDIKVKIQKQKEAANTIGKEVLPESFFKYEDFETAWKTYSNKLKERGKINLYTVLSAKIPKITSEMSVIVEVDNKIQMEQLENEKSDFVQYLRKELNNYKIGIETVITENHEKKNMVYTSHDKYKRMAEKNPTIQELKKRLDLDIEF